MGRALITFLFLLGNVSFAQTTAPADPTLDATGAPGYLKLLPKPAPEPWQRITERERLENLVKTAFSPLAFATPIVGTGISQWLDSPTEWGQGMKGYGKRFANSYTTGLIGNGLTYGVSALLHEDIRYFRSNRQGAKARLGYVLYSPFIARNDEGKVRFSVARFVGPVGAQGISRYWAPPSWQGLDNIAMGYLVWYCQQAGFNFVREFYPSLLKKYRTK